MPDAAKFSFWTDIKQHEFAVPAGYTAQALLPDLLAGLGSADAELRDHMCYEILATWIDQGRFTPEELRLMVEQLLAGLRAGIGEGENDQIFRRTFSALILAELVAYDTGARFLATEEVHRILEAALAYLTEEQDLRGYVPGKGWAHSAAHTADLLYTLARHPALGATDLKHILEAIGAKVQTPTPYRFVDREGYRLGYAVVAVLQRDSVPLPEVLAWFEELGSSGGPLRELYVTGEDDSRCHNTEALLSALLVMLEHQDVPQATRAALLPAAHAALKSFLAPFV